MKRRDDQITVRLAGELRAHLEDEALARGRSLSNLIRQILIDHTAERVAGTATTQQEAA
jgi:predicted HicB family RNase H-like nuclease